MSTLRGPPPESDLADRFVYLPPSDHPKTVIFDLDETLVHCVDDPDNDDPDVILPVTFPTGETVNAYDRMRLSVFKLRMSSSKSWSSRRATRHMLTWYWTTSIPTTS